MENFEQFVEQDRFAKHIAVEMVEAGDGHAVARMRLEDYHLNSHGTVHGGAIFALADAAFAAASNSHGVPAVAINVSISYLKAVSTGTVTAIAKETSLNSTLATYEVRITSDKDELVAIFQGMVYRKQSRPS